MNTELGIKEITNLYKDEWVLLMNPEVEKAKIKKGEVIFHSKSRGEIHRNLPKFKGNKALVYTGKLPENVVVIL